MRVTHEAAHLSAWVVVLDRLLPSAGARHHLFLRVAGVDCEAFYFSPLSALFRHQARRTVVLVIVTIIVTVTVT